MALPWLRMFDVALGMADVARQMGRRSRLGASTAVSRRAPARAGGLYGPLEMRLVGVMMGAIKEAFGRDTQRLQEERERHEAERARADRLLRLELQRQAGERETSRLRTVAAIATAGWLGTWIAFALFATQGAGGVPARVILALAWILLLGALGVSMAGQATVAHALASGDDRVEPSSAGASSVATWLLLTGLAVSSLAVLLA